ncbi:barstar family protein [Paenibacillus sp. PsM32]|uniref:barstar family protein n=1 Tax=Paenibacillus sp. PsM32 TaxID=3030536 RepID=UPI00263BB8AC|nr:barstar family protein [Paenibacillus sp. PsM32]MDN4616710.1 barstar family protein [Paenibacillus sp. PsM32]
MKMVTINGEEFHTINELHETLQQKLELPEFYGKNLDALWDCLTGMIELPLQMEWLNYDVSRQRLGDKADQVLSVLEEAQAEGNGFRIWVRDEVEE